MPPAESNPSFHCIVYSKGHDRPSYGVLLSVSLDCPEGHSGLNQVES